MATTENPGCLFALLRLFGFRAPAETAGRTPTEEPFPYRVRDDFLSTAELSFFRVLTLVVGTRAVICPKVGLGDLLFVTRPNENRSAYNRIRQKHVDFVLCDPTTLRPLFAVELDDRSHARADRAERDTFVDQAFAAASLPLIRIPAQSAYSTQDLTARLGPLLNGVPTAVPPPPTAAPTPAFAGTPYADNRGRHSYSSTVAATTPTCPKCGVTMTLRQVNRGDRLGESFYGCPNYPKCRHTQPA